MVQICNNDISSNHGSERKCTSTKNVSSHRGCRCQRLSQVETQRISLLSPQPTAGLQHAVTMILNLILVILANFGDVKVLMQLLDFKGFCYR